MADKTFNVISICGSLRKGSYNRMVMNALPGLAPAGMSIKEAPPFSEFPLYNADIETSTGVPQAVQKLADAVRAADGVIFVTPEYNFSIPGPLKNAIDWISRVPNQPFAGKPVAIQSATGGPLGGGRMQYDLRRAMLFLDSLTFGRPEIFIGSMRRPARSPISRRLDLFGSSLLPSASSSSSTAASAERGELSLEGRRFRAVSAGAQLDYIPLQKPHSARRTPWRSRRQSSRATANPTANTTSRRCGKPITSASPSTI
jgi:chromate reductase